MVDAPERGDGHSDIDDSSSDRNQEGVGDTGCFEEGRAVVEDEVDTGELLPGLHEDTSKAAKENFVGTVLEAVEVRARAEFFFHAQIGFDVLELGLKLGVGLRSGEETGEGAGGIGITATFDEVAR